MEQETLGGKSASVTCEGAVGADYPMAGDKDRHCIGSDSIRHCTHRLRAMETLCQLQVGDGLAVRYGEERRPNGLLKGCACKEERDRKRAACAMEILV